MNIGNSVVRYLPNELLQVVLLSYYGKIQKFIQTNMNARQRHLTILFFGTLYNFNFSEALSQFNWVKGTYDSNSVVASAISEYGKTKTFVCLKYFTMF